MWYTLSIPIFSNEKFKNEYWNVNIKIKLQSTNDSSTTHIYEHVKKIVYGTVKFFASGLKIDDIYNEDGDIKEQFQNDFNEWVISEIDHNLKSEYIEVYDVEVSLIVRKYKFPALTYVRQKF